MRQSFDILLWLLPLLALCVGAALAFVGLRGRKVDNHPLCAECGFDLIGSSGSLVCPECGNNIADPDAIVLGHRQRRRRPLVAGVLIGAHGLTYLLGLIVITAQGVDLDRHKPVWLLAREADAKALTELNRRLVFNELGDKQVQHVLAAALAEQGKRRDKWVPGWGDFVEAARRMQKVPDAQWRRYLEQAFDFRLVARPRVRLGDPFVLRVDRVRAWCGTNSAMSPDLEISTAAVGGVALRRLVPLSEFRGTRSRWGINDGAERFVAEATIYRLVSGKHAVRADVSVRVRELAFTGLTVSFVVPLHADVTLTQDEPPVRTVADPTLRPQIQSMLRQMALVTVDSEGVMVILTAERPPRGLAFDVVLREGRNLGREWAIGSAAFAATERTQWVGTKPLPGFDLDQVDVLLRVNPQAAVSTLSVQEVWYGEIVLRSVPVHWQPEARRPTTGVAR